MSKSCRPRSTGTEELAGGHTIFPVLPSPFTPGAQRAAEFTEPLWQSLLNTYHKAPFADHYPDQYGNFLNSTLGGVMGQKCFELARNDAARRRSHTFGIRPSPGDAVAFWMKDMGSPNLASRYAFHGGCPLLRGAKDAIQKFVQAGGTNSLPMEHTFTKDKAKAASKGGISNSIHKACKK